MAPKVSRRGQEGAIYLQADTRWKVDVWKEHLEQKTRRHWSYDEVVDYLADMIGVPDENEEEQKPPLTVVE
jgi:hypothetical protein